ncbi:MAG: RNA polymerase sigma-70 factor (ECF subfamily) [Saprospiraceae bacterium]
MRIIEQTSFTKSNKLKQRTKQEREFSAIIEKHKKLIYKIANAYCNNQEDKKDLFQEIVLQLWKAFPNYNPTFAITTWMYRIALNVSISYYRQSKNRKIQTVSENEYILEIAETQDLEDPQNEQLKLLYQFISELKELDKALIILYLEGNKHEVIANILGISKSNIATKIGRIKTRLKKRFENLKK